MQGPYCKGVWLYWNDLDLSDGTLLNREGRMHGKTGTYSFREK